MRRIGCGRAVGRLGWGSAGGCGAGGLGRREARKRVGCFAFEQLPPDAAATTVSPAQFLPDICRWCGGRRGASMSSSEGAGKPVPDGKARPEPEASATTPETTRSGVASPNARPLPLR